MKTRGTSIVCSADLQSAVAPICNRQGVEFFRACRASKDRAGCKPALRQTTNLRYTGFTLIEVLLAVAIFAIVLAAMNGVFYSALRLRNRAARSMEESLPVQQVATIIKHDLQGIVAPGGTLSGSLKSGVATSGMDQQAGTELYTATGTIDETSPWANVQKVSYALRQPVMQTAAGGGKDLVRLVTRNLLPTAQEEVEEQWLMSDVQQLQFYFYDGTQWRTSWDSTAETSVLPKAIKLQIDLVSNSADSRGRAPIELVVPITIYVNTNQTQNAGGQQ